MVSGFSRTCLTLAVCLCAPGKRAASNYNECVSRTISQLGRIAVIASVLIGAGTTRLHADRAADGIVASGKLDGRFLASSLFHIDEFWIKVAGGTEFHRWLSQGLGHPVVVRLAADATRLTDEKNLRILSGMLVHETAPKPTSITTDVVGRLPEGDSGFVHVFFVRDDIAGSGTLGAVTFESADLATVSKFSAFEGARVNIIIEIH